MAGLAAHKTRPWLVLIEDIYRVPLDVNSTGDILSEFYLQPKFGHVISFVGNGFVPPNSAIFCNGIRNSLVR